MFNYRFLIFGLALLPLTSATAIAATVEKESNGLLLTISENEEAASWPKVEITCTLKNISHSDVGFSLFSNAFGFVMELVDEKGASLAIRPEARSLFVTYNFDQVALPQQGRLQPGRSLKFEWRLVQIFHPKNGISYVLKVRWDPGLDESGNRRPMDKNLAVEINLPKLGTPHPDEDLEDTFEQMPDPSNSVASEQTTRAKAEGEFDLHRKDVSRFLVGKMNEPPVRGARSADAVLKSLMKVAPEKTLQWMLDHHDELNPEGRKRLVDTLRAQQNYIENFEILFVLLDDKAEVTNKREAQMWRSPSPYIQSRVCDLAYGAITVIVGWDDGLLPPDLPRLLVGSEAYEVRDQAIQNIKKWWAKDSARVLAGKTALKTNAPDIGQKIKALHVVQTK